jgi:hypothetical protein
LHKWKQGEGTVATDATSGRSVLRTYDHVRPRQGLVRASAWAAVLTGATAIWLAAELQTASYAWLPWLACALPPAAAGSLCLVRRPATSTGPAAVFASCTPAAGYALQEFVEYTGLARTAALFFLLCAAVAVVISATVTAVMIDIAGSVSVRQAVIWTAAALLIVASSIPSRAHFTGSPIQTIFAGNTGGEDAVSVCYLVLLAVPLVIAGLAPARLATIIAALWLPEAAAQLLWPYVFQSGLLRLDVWFYLSCLAWLVVAMVALAQTRSWRSADHSLSSA